MQCIWIFNIHPLIIYLHTPSVVGLRSFSVPLLIASSALQFSVQVHLINLTWNLTGGNAVVVPSEEKSSLSSSRTNLAVKSVIMLTLDNGAAWCCLPGADCMVLAAWCCMVLAPWCWLHVADISLWLSTRSHHHDRSFSIGLLHALLHKRNDKYCERFACLWFVQHPC